VLYEYFTGDFISSKPVFQGESVACKRHPLVQGKEATFWHLISEGRSEEDRLPNLRRCERIRWPRPIVENAVEPGIKIWENERAGERRICLWLEDCEYLVVLARRSGYVLLWTAYPVVETHRKRKLQREFEASRKS
jgi:hypothetical protein